MASLPYPHKCVVKPNESAGSDSVTLCKGAVTEAEASERDQLEAVVRQATDGFNLVHGQLNGLGHVNDGALVQVPCAVVVVVSAVVVSSFMLYDMCCMAAGALSI